MSVKFGNLGWRSIFDYQEWIKTNFKTNPYGLIINPLLMLDRVFGSEDGENDNHLKALESRVKLKIATGREAASIKALHYKRPRLFHSGSSVHVYGPQQVNIELVGGRHGIKERWRRRSKLYREAHEPSPDHDLSRQQLRSRR